MNKLILTLGIIILISALIGFIKIPVIFGSASAIWLFLVLIGLILIVFSLKKSSQIKNKSYWTNII